MVEEHIPGGTLSGGIDLWLKRVPYPIINKWYAGYEKDGNYYHTDRGEGLDNYHVGPSLGAGGTALLSADSTLIRSQNFTDYSLLFSGPLRSKFILDYAPYGNDSIRIYEKKTISLDIDQNLSKVQLNIQGNDKIVSGISLQDKSGEIYVDSSAVILNYFSKHADSYLNVALVVDPKYVDSTFNIISDTNDYSHSLIQMKTIDHTIVYYTGFYWTKSGQFKDQKEWFNYLKNFANRIQNPILVTKE